MQRKEKDNRPLRRLVVYSLEQSGIAFYPALFYYIFMFYTVSHTVHV